MNVRIQSLSALKHTMQLYDKLYGVMMTPWRYCGCFVNLSCSLWVFNFIRRYTATAPTSGNWEGKGAYLHCQDMFWT